MPSSQEKRNYIDSLLTRLIPAVVIVSTVKTIAGLKTYFQFGLLLVVGKEVVIERRLLSTAFLAIFVALVFFFSEDYTLGQRTGLMVYLKWFQFLAMLVAVRPLARVFLNEDYVRLLLKFTFIYSTFELVLGSVMGTHVFFNKAWGHLIYRANGIVGEPNFSSALLLFFLALAFIHKLHRRYHLLIMFFIFACGSKTSITLALIIFIVAWLPQIRSIVGGASLIVLAAYPLLVEVSFTNLPTQISASINNITSQRYFQHYHYTYEGLNLLRGDGFGGVLKLNYANKSEDLKEVIKKTGGRIIVAEQHSLPVEILFKLGVVPYSLFLILLLAIVYGCVRYSIDSFGFLAVALLNYVFLNGLFDIPVYASIGMLIFMIISKYQNTKVASRGEVSC